MTTFLVPPMGQYRGSFKDVDRPPPREEPKPRLPAPVVSDGVQKPKEPLEQSLEWLGTFEQSTDVGNKMRGKSYVMATAPGYLSDWIRKTSKLKAEMKRMGREHHRRVNRLKEESSSLRKQAALKFKGVTKREYWGWSDYDDNRLESMSDAMPILITAGQLRHLLSQDRFPTPGYIEANWRDALDRIAEPADCGCVPCRGQCRSKESLEAQVVEMQEFARSALVTPGTKRMPTWKPLKELRDHVFDEVAKAIDDAVVEESRTRQSQSRADALNYVRGLILKLKGKKT